MKGEQATERGFSIRCPHCLEWRDWYVPPKKVTLDSEEELREILDGLHADPEGYSHRKLLRCDQPRWVCPAPIEAFVCKNEADALRFLETVKAWSLKRDFRLYKKDHRSRWYPYCGILFSTQRVPRQQDIELAHLLDQDLLRRAIVGISIALKAPLTVYTVQIFKREGESHVYWVPIEAYALEEPQVPPRYNAFCRICREMAIGALLPEFSGKASPENCPHVPRLGVDGSCAGREAACLRAEWNQCPAFLQKRKKRCPCYQSDLKIIDEVKRAWVEQKAPLANEADKCWAGFTEIAAPVVVHDHLLGVAMSGQFVLAGAELPPVSRLIRKWPLLEDRAEELERIRTILLGRMQPSENEKRDTEQFRVNSSILNERGRLLRENVSQIAQWASARHRDIRARAEAVFKQELMGRVENLKRRPAFPRVPVLEILNRMRRFWGFGAAFFLSRPADSEDMFATAVSTRSKSKSFRFPGKRIGKIGFEYLQSNPVPWVLDRGDATHAEHPWVRRFLPIFNSALNDAELEVPSSRYHFIVAVPFAGQLFAFWFADPNESIIGLPYPGNKGRIARLVIEHMTTTCTEVVHKLGDIWYHNAREQAWREFSGHASHRIGNEISTVGTLLDVLADKLRSDPEYADRWRENLSVMQGCIRSSKQMLTQLVKLTAEVQPDRKWVDVDTLIRRALLGAVPVAASVEIDVSPETKKAFVDPELMEQVLRELAVNAVRVVGENVEITVRVTAEPAGSSPKRNLRILFRDNGPGIPAEEWERIFEPFVTLTGGGTGLGLTTARRIIEAHGGDIKAAPSHKGACFIMWLPLEGVSE